MALVKDIERDLIRKIRKGELKLEDIPTMFTASEDVAAALMEQDPMQLKNLPLSMRNNVKVVGEAVKRDYLAMEYAGGIIKNDQEAMLKLQGINGKVYQYRGVELENDPDFLKESELKNRDASMKAKIEHDKEEAHLEVKQKEKPKAKKKEFTLTLERRLE